ncbi:D-arabinono-1,4-lactone oxidase [Pseudonocardia eucalypti]|uniref:D-arabinono-1,4-lactone oxidase n=1 Tax=Pseudonocardia eucalypti TaxID=648755 RepID=A0ABP9PF60_9PSEU|nr:L-gulonolactone oxidase [Pseudonocardia eucalypti]
MWTNWSGGQRSAPHATVRPLDEAGVRAAVRRAAASGRRVRPFGAGHSFSPLAVTDDVALDLSALTGVVGVAGRRVRVRAGTTLAELNAVLADRDLALGTLADVDTPTVAGAIATGTHGSSPKVGSLSAQVTALRMVDGHGQAAEVPAAELDAARTALGALGVITEVELTVVPARRLRVSQARVPLAEALAGGYLDGHDWAEFSVFPYAEEALARWADAVSPDPASDAQPEPDGARSASLRNLVESRLVRAAAVGGGVALGRSVPRLVPAINRVATALTSTGAVTDLPHRVLVARPVVRWEECEWAVPRERLADAVGELLAAITERELDVAFPVDVRVGPAETGWLHPAHQRATGWIAVHTAVGADPEPLRLAAEVLGGHQGRPHWGKRHRWTASQLAEAYPRYAEFLTVRDRRDPNRVFTNPHLDALLGH